MRDSRFGKNNRPPAGIPGCVARAASSFAGLPFALRSTPNMFPFFWLWTGAGRTELQRRERKGWAVRRGVGPLMAQNRAAADAAPCRQEPPYLQPFRSPGLPTSNFPDPYSVRRPP